MKNERLNGRELYDIPTWVSAKNVFGGECYSGDVFPLFATKQICNNRIFRETLLKKLLKRILREYQIGP